MTSGIYQIRHIASGRRYIGQAVDFRRRWQRHQQEFRRGDHFNAHLLAAWRAHGPEAFSFEPLIICAVADLELYEQLLLDGLAPEFNISRTARSRRGVPQPREAVERAAAKNRGRTRSPETCERLSLASTGKTHSPASRVKMRLAKIGRRHTPNAIANMGAAQAARMRPSAEYDSRRGVKRDPVVIERSASARRGQKRSPEAIARMTEAALKMDPAKREKIAAARRAARAPAAAAPAPPAESTSVYHQFLRPGGLGYDYQAMEDAGFDVS